MKEKSDWLKVTRYMGGVWDLKLGTYKHELLGITEEEMTEEDNKVICPECKCLVTQPCWMGPTHMYKDMPLYICGKVPPDKICLIDTNNIEVKRMTTEPENNPIIKTQLDQTRIEGIREGFEAARETSGPVGVPFLDAFTYRAVDDYLKSREGK